ncbi:MAG: T9SS type A sorting domain-containing protein, partial [candidate division KSB1 bacterium]|nr:T9SS type A sorting domain-containing protein [candidate division KSB1 bacterium]
NYYDIYGNFRDIMLDISRLKGSLRYLVTYTSPGAFPGSNQIKLELHYAGLGGFGYAQYQHPLLGNQLAKSLNCYPNPFNPVLRIVVDLADETSGTIDIFNIRGQRIRSFELHSARPQQVVEWDARDQFLQEVAAGPYFLRLRVTDKKGRLLQNQTTKILYMK